MFTSIFKYSEKFDEFIVSILERNLEEISTISLLKSIYFDQVEVSFRIFTQTRGNYRKISAF